MPTDALKSKFQHLSANLWSGQLLYTFRLCAPRPLHSLVDPITPGCQSRRFVGPSSWNDLSRQLRLEFLFTLFGKPEDYFVCQCLGRERI